MNLGRLLGCLYDFDTALDLRAQSLEICQEIESTLGEMINLRFLSWVYFSLGEYEEAETYLNKYVEVARKVGRHDEDVNMYARLARFFSSMGDYNRAVEYFDELTEIDYEYENPFIESIAINIGWYKQHIGEPKSVLEYCQKSWPMFVERKAIHLELQRLLLSGNAKFALGELNHAEENYQKAKSLGFEMHRQRHAFEAQAGLARVYMARGEVQKALTQVNEILAYMQTNTPPKGSLHPLDGTEEPFRILLTSYKVLKANDDLRTEAILKDAYNLLQTRAANISDEHLRHCFLNNVAVNLEIVETYEKNRLGALKT
jgi:tetratricopeptide (TPR) repeat protein